MPNRLPYLSQWCNLGRNKGHNGQLTPHIYNWVDIIDTIDRVDKKVQNIESVGLGDQKPRLNFLMILTEELASRATFQKHTKWCNRGATAMDTMDTMDTMDKTKPVL